MITQLIQVGFLSHNFRLAELYLHDNLLSDVSGQLGHMTTLRVLFLHNNQLTDLQKVVMELKHMTGLLNLSESVKVTHD